MVMLTFGSNKHSARPSDILSQTGGPVPIIFATLKILKIVIFQLLIQLKIVEFTTQGKLLVDFLLADVEVLDIEETNVLCGVS